MSASDLDVADRTKFDKVTEFNESLEPMSLPPKRVDVRIAEVLFIVLADIRAGPQRTGTLVPCRAGLHQQVLQAAAAGGSASTRPGGPFEMQ